MNYEDPGPGWQTLLFLIVVGGSLWLGLYYIGREVARLVAQLLA